MNRLISTIFTFILGLASMVTPGRANTVVDEEFYRRMINTDIQTLKAHAGHIIVSHPDSAIAYLSVVAAASP